MKIIMDKTKRTPLNAAQKELLVEFLVKHKQLQAGRFTASFTKKTAQNLWQELAVALNSIPNGAKKSWRQWRKTWQDQKKNTKIKLRNSKVHAGGTGGGPPLQDVKLSDHEKNIASLINPVTVSGDPPIDESEVTFDNQDMENENTDTLMMDIENEATATVPQEEGSHSVEEASAQSSTQAKQKLKSRAPNRIKQFNKILEASQNLLRTCEGTNKYQQDYYKEKLKLLKLENARRGEYEEKKIKLLQEKNALQYNILQQLELLTSSLCTKKK